ncbi:MAG: hypothetical protein NTZ14_01880 [Hyphomicrobiales bacterium]|nr:hypothetical protein [Hyphomicrobiales bacterium]
MTVTIEAAVGYGAPNRAADVRKIHELLARIPPEKGGAPRGFDPNTGYSPRTDKLILDFQKFHRLHPADARVDRDRAVLASLNRLTGELRTTAPTPVVAIVTGIVTGHAYVKGFNGKAKRHKGRFRVPTYKMQIGVADTYGDVYKIAGKPVVEFDVLRFGIKFNPVAFDAGRGFHECFTMQGPPVGEFSLTRNSYDGGSWLLKGEYLIHAGPREPRNPYSDDNLKSLYGALGCIQPVGPAKMLILDGVVRRLAFGDTFKEDSGWAEDADERISMQGAFHCVVQRAATPPMVPLTDFRDIRGPHPAPA